MLNFVKILAISPLKVLPDNDTPTHICTTTQSNILKLEEVGLFNVKMKFVKAIYYSKSHVMTN